MIAKLRWVLALFRTLLVVSVKDLILTSLSTEEVSWLI